MSQAVPDLTILKRSLHSYVLIVATGDVTPQHNAR